MTIPKQRKRRAHPRVYQFECDDCGELITTPHNDMQGARCNEVSEHTGEDGGTLDDQCPGEMQLVDSFENT